jgi:DNA-binding transcriptional regulator YhcF (GntR family)
MTKNIVEQPIAVEIRIDGESRVPKYMQVINSIVEDIQHGVLHVGQRVPSINEISEMYYLSRDTAEKAYNYLKEKQIIVSVKGKGYYVARTVLASRLNILFLINKLSSYKLQIYNAFVTGLGNNGHVDLNVYHCDPKLFLNALQETAGRYDYYVVMPHFKDSDLNHENATPEVLDALKRIPKDKLLIIDNLIPSLGSGVPAVYQDFKDDIYESLQEGLPRLKNYQKIILVFPANTVYPYPAEIRKGFEKFCINFNFDFEIVDQIYNDMDLRKNDAYVIIEENDLVVLMRQLREKGLTAGVDIGIISYNDTPLKEVLGITVISTDFKVMGETTAYMILKRKSEVVKNVFRFINRDSV